MSTQPSVSSPADSVLSDFANVTAGMNRFLTGLSGIPLFARGRSGASEWMALSVLLQHEGISSGQLARKLGISGQRVNQIANRLRKAGLISISSSQEDSRRNELRTTAAGKNQLRLINRKMRSFIEIGLGEREIIVSRLAKQIPHLMKIVVAAKPAAGPRRSSGTLERGK